MNQFEEQLAELFRVCHFDPQKVMRLVNVLIACTRNLSIHDREELRKLFRQRVDTR